MCLAPFSCGSKERHENRRRLLSHASAGAQVALGQERVLGLPPNTASGDRKNIADRFKDNWFVSIFALCCAVVTATWVVADHVRVSPRDHEIVTLKDEIATLKTKLDEKNAQSLSLATIPKIVLQRTWVSMGGSVTTDDGSCFIHVDHVGPFSVRLSVTVGAEEPKKLENVRSGTRLTLPTQTTVYYVDVHEINENKVGIEVTRQLVSKPTQKVSEH